MTNKLIEFFPEENITPVVIDTTLSKDHYRARVYNMPSGATVTIPVREGSRGPLYTEQLTTSKHGKLRTTAKYFRLMFDIPASEGPGYAAECIGEETIHFITFLKNLN